MGLLDALYGTPDKAQAMGLLGAQMMAGNTPQGLLSATQFLGGADERATQKQYRDMQMLNLQSEIEARRIATQQKQSNQDFVRSIFPGGDMSAPQVDPGAFKPSPSQAGPMGPTMPPSMLPQSMPGSRLANLTFDQLAGLKARGGVDLVDLHKYANDPLKLEQGSTYQNRVTGQREYMPKVGEGMAPDAGGFYAPLPGYAQGQASIEGAKAAAIERAKANLDPVRVYNPATQQEEFVPRTQVVGQPQSPQRAPMTSPAEAGMRTQVQGDMGPNPQVLAREIAATTADLQRVSDPSSRQQLQAHLADLQRQAANIPGPMAAGPSAPQARANAASGELNTSWIRSSYEPTIAQGAGARDLLETVQVTRQAMQNLGGTGWTTQTKAAGAAILTGLGIAPDNAKMFAANAEVFQSKVVERINAELNLAKGPQTDQDAQRATKTWASLKNTTKANEFILDMAEAKAQRDQVKAKFYQQAMPLARDKGDLSEVDREWAKLAPSIFTMPSLRRWAGGIK